MMRVTLVGAGDDRDALWRIFYDMADDFAKVVMRLITESLHRANMHNDWPGIIAISHEIQRDNRTPIQWDETAIATTCTINIPHDRYSSVGRLVGDHVGECLVQIEFEFDIRLPIADGFL